MTSVCNKEMADAEATRIMMRGERNADIRAALKEISRLETRHIVLWREMLEGSDGLGDRRTVGNEVRKIMLMHMILGTALTIKIIERKELEMYRRVYNAQKKFRLSRKEARAINEIEKEDLMKVGPLSTRIVQYNSLLNNIKDVILGMNDGLVEVLAAVVGFAAALHTTELVILGGIIVAVSGTISMTVGAYLSTESEKSMKVKKDGASAPKLSAGYMGLFYIIGAAFPILPFALGAHGSDGIILSVVVTCVVLTVVSVIISLLSDTRIYSRVLKTLALSILAASATVVLGTYARYVLHLVI